MKLLIIEDDDIKFGYIYDLIQGSNFDITIFRAASYQKGVETLVHEEFDFVILDMSLPVSDIADSPVGVKWITFGGQYIVRDCLRRGIMLKVVILTQYSSFIRQNMEVSFNDLRNELLNEYPEHIVDCVRIVRSNDEWKHKILRCIENEFTDN